MLVGVNLYYVLLAVIFIIIGLVQLKFHFREWLRSFPRFYGYVSLGITAAITVGFFGYVNLGSTITFDNLLLSRVFGGHLFTWVTIFLIFYRFGFGDVMRGFAFAAAFMCMHESIYTLEFLASGQAFNQYLAGSLIPSSAVYIWAALFLSCLGSMLFLYLAFMGKENIEALIRTALVIGICTMVVFASGPFITMNFGGPTSLFGNTHANIVEQLTWVIPGIWLMFDSLISRFWRRTAFEPL